MYTFLVLTPVAVVEGGVTLVRESALGALSIRSLAERLGVTPMALYRHVETAQALEEAVVDAILAQVPAVSADAGWCSAAKVWAEGARDVLTSHPGVARYVLTHWFRLPRVLDWVEALLTAAERHGSKGTAAVAAVNAVFVYVLMRVEAEESIRRAGVVHRRLPRGAKSEARWPRLKANASEYEVARLDVHFEFGLGALLRGIERRPHARS